MIIGISGDSFFNKSQVSRFIVQEYGFEYIDGEQIFEKILSSTKFREELAKKDWREDKLLLLKIKNEFDL